MNYYLKNSFLAIKKIVQLLKRDVLKHPISNYFNKDHAQRVLISYITKPFKDGIELTHTNFVEVLEIAKIFNSLNYIVDVVDYNYEGYLDYKKYDIVFGFGEPLVNSFNFITKKNIKRIYYGTGMHISVQNHNSLKRIEDVKNKKGNWIIDSGRVVEKAWSQQTTLVDAMIVMGNEEVKKSYQRYFDREIYMIDPSFYKVLNFSEIVNSKNYDNAKNNYLWFGSNGLIHKGLDLLLEGFKFFPDLHLHVCGPIDAESNFQKTYYNELYNTPNIHTYGFVKMDSAIFKELLLKCAFVIYPSCSEGGSPAVITICGNGGLIPILTKETTLDVDDFGVIIDSCDIDSVKKSIADSQNFSSDKIKTLSKIVGKKMNKYSLNNFAEQFKKYIEQISTK
jgi:hypothetical protein